MFIPKNHAYFNRFTLPVENDFEQISAVFEIYAWNRMRMFTVSYALVSEETGEVYSDARGSMFFNDTAEIPVKLFTWIVEHCPAHVADSFRTAIPVVDFRR